jgi:hypothetical protein
MWCSLRQWQAHWHSLTCACTQPVTAAAAAARAQLHRQRVLTLIAAVLATSRLAVWFLA